MAISHSMDHTGADPHGSPPSGSLHDPPTEVRQTQTPPATQSVAQRVQQLAGPPKENKLVLNLSDHNLTEVELSFLEKGLKFCPTYHKSEQSLRATEISPSSLQTKGAL